MCDTPELDATERWEVLGALEISLRHDDEVVDEHLGSESRDVLERVRVRLLKCLDVLVVEPLHQLCEVTRHDISGGVHVGVLIGKSVVKRRTNGQKSSQAKPSQCNTKEGIDYEFSKDLTRWRTVAS